MRQLPAYRIHKSRNPAYVRLRGKFVDLGRAHSPESHASYHAAVAEHLAAVAPTARTMTAFQCLPSP